MVVWWSGRLIGQVWKPRLIREYEENKARLAAEYARKKEENERKHKEKIRDIATYLFDNKINFIDVQNAYQIIKDYEKKVSSLNRKIRNADDIRSESILTSSTNPLQKLIENSKANKSFNLLTEELEKYETQNKMVYLQAKSFVTALPKDTQKFCKEYGSEIINYINELISKEKKKEEQDKQAKIEQVKKNRSIDFEKIANENKIKEQNDSIKLKQDKIDRTLRDLGSLIASLQQSLSANKKNPSFNVLETIENYLDLLVELSDYIPENYYKKIDSCQKKLAYVFEHCENKEEMIINLNIITERFKEILENKQ